MDDAPKRLTLKDWAEDDRPREKMLKYGVTSLSDTELLAILLRSGSAGCTVVEVAQQMLNRVNNNLNELGKLDVVQLTKFNGIGPAKAATVLAALELGRRRKATPIDERPVLTCSNAIVNLMQPLMADLPHEECWMLMMNNSKRLIDKVKVSQGGLDRLLVDVRLLLRTALERHASAIAIVHNHPSGNNQPSDHDRNLTFQIKRGAEAVGIAMLDHIIITENNCFSFADECLDF